MWTRAIGLAGACALGLSGGQPQDGEDLLFARIETIAKQAFERERLTGLAVHVSFGSELASSKAWGFADSAKSLAESPDAQHSAGAALEPFVAVAVLQLADEGKLALDDPLAKHLPDLGLADARITIAQALSHTSELPSFTDFVEANHNVLDVARVLAWLRTQALLSEPGQCWSHSATDTLLLGLIVEKLDHALLADALKSRVFTRAGMSRTAFRHEASAGKGRAHAVEASGRTIDLGSAPFPFGADDLWTSASDLTRFMRALVELRLVGEHGWRALSTPVECTDGSRAPFTHGLSYVAPGEFASLSFGLRDWDSHMRVAWYPSLEMTIALGSSTTSADLAGLERRLARAVLATPQAEIVDLSMSAEERVLYVGSYYLGCTRVVIANRDERLFYSSPFDETFRLLHQGAGQFVSERDPLLRVIFRVDAGRALGFILDVNGWRSTAQRMD